MRLFYTDQQRRMMWMLPILGAMATFGLAIIHSTFIEREPGDNSDEPEGDDTWQK